MTDILIDTIIDNIKIFPFLLAAYLFLEWLEKKTSPSMLEKIRKSGKYGPLLGSLCGIVPQCGLSVVGANFYAARIITLGTLIAIFLSTSDEMILVMLSQSVPSMSVIKIVAYKFLFGCVCGIITDAVLKNKAEINARIESLCESENCHCAQQEGILMPALYHAVKITIFVFVVSLFLNVLMHFFAGIADMQSLFAVPLVGEILAALIGLIPNCSASVLLTQLYVKGVINIGTMLSGTMVNSGVALLVLFKVNRHIKENIFIVGLLYLFAIFGGVLSNIFWWE